MKWRAKELLLLTAPVLLLAGAVVYQKQKQENPLRIVLLSSKFQKLSDIQKRAGYDKNIQLRFSLKGQPQHLPLGWSYQSHSAGNNTLSYLLNLKKQTFVTREKGQWKTVIGNFESDVNCFSSIGEAEIHVLTRSENILKRDSRFIVFDFEGQPTNSIFPKLKMGRFFLNLNTAHVHHE